MACSRRPRHSSIPRAALQLAGKSIALLFFNPSMRTRTSFELGAFQLGGHAVVLQPGKDAWPIEFDVGTVMDGEAEEHVAEVARVLSRYVDLIGVRAFPKFQDWAVDREDRVIKAFAKYATVPVINMETITHPMQELAHVLALQAAFRHGRFAWQEVRADLDLSPQAAQYRGCQLRVADRHALRHGRDPAVPDAGLRARRALHGFRQAQRRRERRLADRQPRIRRARIAARTWSTPRAGVRCRTSAAGRTKNRSARRTSTSSSTKRRWR